MDIYMVIIWFIITLLFIILEGISYNLVCIWFSIGALVTIPFTFLPLYIQLFIFFISSILSLIIIRKKAIRYLKNSRASSEDRIIGKSVEIQDIKIIGTSIVYTVYLDGKYWSAISKNKLNIGEYATVSHIEGNKLILI